MMSITVNTEEGSVDITKEVRILRITDVILSPVSDFELDSIERFISSLIEDERVYLREKFSLEQIDSMIMVDRDDISSKQLSLFRDIALFTTEEETRECADISKQVREDMKDPEIRKKYEDRANYLLSKIS